jgi:hypothetical protein
MNIKNLLDEEIQDEFNALAKLEVGSDSYRGTVDGLTKLMDRAIELKKFEAERDERIEARESEQSLKLQQLREDRKDRIAKNCIAVGTALLGVGVTIWGTCATFKFEEEGTISSVIGRGFINKLIPKK